MYQSTALIVPSDNRAVQLYSLPSFDGKPEDWPLFFANYNDTTREFGYNNRQNLMRLQKALQGDAKKTVESLLIFPDDVKQAIEELQFNYGRADLLVRCQLQKIQKITPIPEYRLQEVLVLSNRVRNMVAVLMSAKCEQHLMNPMLLEKLVEKLPHSKQFEWARHATALGHIPTIKDFSNWVSELAKVVSSMSLNAITFRSNTPNNTYVYNRQATTTAPKRILLNNDNNGSKRSKISCWHCKQEHTINECSEFQSLAVNDRWKVIKANRLCFSCLRNGHNLQSCIYKKVCGDAGCNRMHNPLLHDNNQQMHSVGNEHVLNCRQNIKLNHLFKIVPIYLYGSKGTISTYAMFDDGSSVSLIDEQVADKLGLKGHSSSLTLQWYDDALKTEKSRRVSLEIKGALGGEKIFPLKNVYTVKNLALPKQSFSKGNYEHLKNLPMHNYTDATPVILLGLDNCHLGLPLETVQNGPDQPIAIVTSLGWVIFGKSGRESDQALKTLHIKQSPTLKKINELIEDYFSIENFGVKQTDLVLESDENKHARQILNKTTKNIGGRYETGLLWKSDVGTLPESFEMAKKRLIGIEKKMANDAKYAEAYKAEMKKYVDKGYATLVTQAEQDLVDDRTWYLPHFGVINPNKPNKLRVVFDAAATSQNISLNSQLARGPEQAQPLIKVLFQFRQGKIAVAGDIQEMFSQVKIRKDDQNAQRYLWRDGDTNSPIQIYRMTSMIFGAACSPCCAEYIKNLNAKTHTATMPKGAKIIVENTYVDDLVVSFDTIDEAKEICLEAILINAAAGFNLRGFLSNSSELEKVLNKEDKNDKKIINMERHSNTDRVLGLHWDKASDTLKFQIKFHKYPNDIIEGNQTPTKREMLGVIMSIYDPFGLLANFTIFSKLLLQATWKLQIKWDELLPEQLARKWRAWCVEFKKLQHFAVPRCYSRCLTTASHIELHIFVDASQSAYAAVGYLRIVKPDDVDIAFVAAKARCAPVRGMSIPRLELQAAVMGCRLKATIEESHDFVISTTTFWCDSKNVIAWIQSHTREYKQFVACRIAEILSTTDPEQWNWLPGKANVADDATRGQVMPKFDLKSRWIIGPEFLKLDKQFWPLKKVFADDHNDEEVIHHRVHVSKQKLTTLIDYENFSSFNKMIRAIAQVYRFITNCRMEIKKKGKTKGPLTSHEIIKAEKTLCRLVQEEAFRQEIEHLKQHKNISKSSEIYNLTPYLDNEGILRVKGRLDNAYCLQEWARRPIIMPKGHLVSKLIMKCFHWSQHHQNDHVAINNMRQRFWITNARSLLYNIKKSCPSCIIAKAKPTIPQMGQLPVDRVTPYVRPFSYTGVDFCGPFYVTIGRRREKRWVALFTCLSVRAVHLEVAQDLSSDAFLICLRNFINRRGTPVRLRSDNGTNFIGAQKKLNQDDSGFDFERVQEVLSTKRIEWIFNCPLQPNAGGCWERLIQCVKRVLARVLKEEAPKLHIFTSVLIEAENIINSRPLTDLPVTPEEDEPLTPNHFLIGCLNSTQTPGPNEERICLRKNWRIAQNLKDRFWKRWVVEYLPQLLKREKWFDEVKPLQKGELVIILDYAQPRSKWQKGIITQVFPGKDGQVRTALVKTSTGVLRRPASKLASLTFSESL